MKIKEIKKDIPEGYELIVGCYADEKDVNKMAVMLDINKQTTPSDILLAVSRINRIVAKTINIPYPAFLKMLDGTAKYDEKYGSLNLSEEQFEKMVGKELKGYDLKRD